MRGLVNVLILWTFFLPVIHSISQPNATQFFNIREIYEFSKQIELHAKIVSAEPIKEIHLFIEPEGQETHFEIVQINPQGDIAYKYDLAKNPIRSFTPITYWFRAVITDDAKYYSHKSTLEYFDNRINWQVLENDQFHIYWNQGDLSLGQTISNAAQAGLESAQTYFNISPPALLRIFAYAHAANLRSALQLPQQPWMASSTSPDLGIILMHNPCLSCVF